MTADHEPCLICKHPTKSLHFQVNCCRACASFFRRSVKAKLVYHCQRGTGKCDLTTRNKNKPICRYCRFKKCTEIGMRIELDSQPETVVDEPAKDVISDTFTGSPVSMNGKKVDYDATPLLNIIKENLLKNNTATIKSAPGVVLTPMQKTSHELKKFLSLNAPDPTKIIVSYDIDVKNNVRFHEEYLLRLARLVTTLDEFVSIDTDQKYNVFRHFWATFHFVERIYQSLAIFGTEEDDMRYLLSNTTAIDLGPVFGVPRQCEITEQIKMFQPFVNLTFRHLINPLKRLKPTHFEMAFITSNLLWNVIDIHGVTPKTLQQAEKLLERNAAEMHSYYIYEMKLPNYAARLASIVQLTPAAEAMVRAKKELLIVGKFIDFCEVDFTDCELME